MQGRRFPEVDPGNGGEDGDAVEERAEGDGVVDGVEGEDDAPHGAQGREGVQSVGGVRDQEVAEGGEEGGVEDGRVVEVLIGGEKRCQLNLS